MELYSHFLGKDQFSGRETSSSGFGAGESLKGNLRGWRPSISHSLLRTSKLTPQIQKGPSNGSQCIRGIHRFRQHVLSSNTYPGGTHQTKFPTKTKKHTSAGPLTPPPPPKKKKKKKTIIFCSACPRGKETSPPSFFACPRVGKENIATVILAPLTSSQVMQMLRDIKAGKAIESCSRAPAIGSYLHKKARRSRRF